MPPFFCSLIVGNLLICQFLVNLVTQNTQCKLNPFVLNAIIYCEILNDYKEKLASFIHQFSLLKSEVAIISAYQNFISENTAGAYLDHPIEKHKKSSNGIGNKFEVRKLKFKLLIYLLQHIEYFWYKDFTVFENTEELFQDASIYKLDSLRKKYQLLFQYRHLKTGVLSRSQNGVRKRIDIIRRNPAGNTIGMQTGYSRVEIMVLINEINANISTVYGKQIKLQVNSILRTFENQQNLINIGYNATFFSSHCVGYAIDVERKWYALNDRRLFKIIRDCLSIYHDKEIINLIDEGVVWHVCLNPKHIKEYQQKANNWLLSKY